MRLYKYKNRCNMSGSIIRECRERQHLSQEQLAARLQLRGCNLNQKAVSRIETGERVVADYELVAFAQALGVCTSTLLQEERALQEV